jgi:hypothetical protein
LLTPPPHWTRPGQVPATKQSSYQQIVGRQGVEDIKGKTPLSDQLPKQPRRKLSKAELREQAEAAFLAWRAGQTAKYK